MPRPLPSDRGASAAQIAVLHDQTKPSPRWLNLSDFAARSTSPCDADDVKDVLLLNGERCVAVGGLLLPQGHILDALTQNTS